MVGATGRQPKAAAAAATPLAAIVCATICLIELIGQPSIVTWLHRKLGADAKGVAGMGKVGQGENTAGSDKAGQQVPPEVYNALTYAGAAFLLTLSIPVILYGLNKLLNKIEDCFGCGPSTKKPKGKQKKNCPSNSENGIMIKRNKTAGNDTNKQRLENQQFEFDRNFNPHEGPVREHPIAYHKHPYHLESNRNRYNIVTTRNHPNNTQHHQLIHQPTAIDYSQSYSPDKVLLTGLGDFRPPNSPNHLNQHSHNHTNLSNNRNTPSGSPHVLGSHQSLIN